MVASVLDELVLVKGSSDGRVASDGSRHLIFDIISIISSINRSSMEPRQRRGSSQNRATRPRYDFDVESTRNPLDDRTLGRVTRLFSLLRLECTHTLKCVLRPTGLRETFRDLSVDSDSVLWLLRLFVQSSEVRVNLASHRITLCRFNQIG